MASYVGKRETISWERIYTWYAAGLFFLYALLLLVHRRPPALTDYSDWTYEGVLLRNHLLGIPDRYHALKPYPVPNDWTTVGIGLLSLVTSWQLAAKVWLCALLLTAFLSARHMIRTCGGNAGLWVLGPAAIFLNVNFWYGFINFEWGLCWTILVASLLLRNERREWIFGVLLGLAFFSHMIPFAFSALLLSIFAIQQRRFRLLWQLLPGMLLSVWYLCGRFVLEANADGNAGMVSPVQSYSAAFWAYKVNSYLKSFGFINVGTPRGSVTIGVLGTPLFLVLFAANALFCGTVGFWLINAGVLSFKVLKKQQFLWIAASVFFVLFLLAPGTMAGVSDPGSRMLQTLIAVILFQGSSVFTRQHQLHHLVLVCALSLQIAGVYQFDKVAFYCEKQAMRGYGLPRRLTIFSHVPNHVEDYFYAALQRGDMELRIFPTAMFLNEPEAKEPPPQFKTKD